MRVVVIVFAALLTLGLAAFGVVAAQRANAPAAATAMSTSHGGAGRAAGSEHPCNAGARAGRRSRPKSNCRGGEADGGDRRPRRSSDRPCPEQSDSRRSSGTAERRSARAVSGEERSDLRQAGRHGPRPHRRDRHHRRPRVRHRAFQAVRFPAREGSGADLRRRPVAGEYADGDQGAHRHVRQRRRSSRSASTPAGAPTYRRWWPRPA